MSQVAQVQEKSFGLHQGEKMLVLSVQKVLSDQEKEAGNVSLFALLVPSPIRGKEM